MIGQRTKFTCILLLITCLSASGQSLLHSWKTVESRFIERNTVASEINAFSLGNNLITKEEACNIQARLDSAHSSVKCSTQLNRDYLERLANLNKHIEQDMSVQLSNIKAENFNSNSGNAVRLVALYRRAKEEFDGSIENYNRQAISNKRKDLVFH